MHLSKIIFFLAIGLLCINARCIKRQKKIKRVPKPCQSRGCPVTKLASNAILETLGCLGTCGCPDVCGCQNIYLEDIPCGCSYCVDGYGIVNDVLGCDRIPVIKLPKMLANVDPGSLLPAINLPGLCQCDITNCQCQCQNTLPYQIVETPCCKRQNYDLFNPIDNLIVKMPVETILQSVIIEAPRSVVKPNCGCQMPCEACGCQRPNCGCQLSLLDIPCNCQLPAIGSSYGLQYTALDAPCSCQLPAINIPCGCQLPGLDCGCQLQAFNSPCGCQLPVPNIPYAYQLQSLEVPCEYQLPAFDICCSCGCQLPGCGCQLPGCGCQLPGCGCQLPGCGCQLPGCGCQLPGCGCQLPSCGCQITDCGCQSVPAPVGCACQLPGCGCQLPGCGCLLPGCGCQITDCGCQSVPPPVVGCGKYLRQVTLQPPFI